MAKKEEIISFSEVNFRTPNYYTSTINFTREADRSIGFHRVFKINNLARVRVVAEIKQNCNSLGKIDFRNISGTKILIPQTSLNQLKNDYIWDGTVDSINLCNYTQGMNDKIISNDTLGILITEEEPTEGKIVFHIWGDALNSTGEIIVY